MATPTIQGPSQASEPTGLPSDPNFIYTLRDHALGFDGEFGSSVLGLTQPVLDQWSGLSRPSVASLLERFEDVLEHQDLAGKRVAADKARRWALLPRAGIVVAVEIGQEITRVAVSDLFGRLYAEDHKPLAVGDADETLDLVVANITELIEKASAGRAAAKDVVGVCVSLEGPVDRVKGVFRAPPSVGQTDPGHAALAQWQLMRAREQLTSRLGWDDVTFLVDNNANLSALAEYVWGAGRWAASRLSPRRSPYENVFYVDWSRGIGSGVIVECQLYRGGSSLTGGGIAGELGHTVVAPEETDACPRCGKAGCLEMVAGWGGLVKERNGEGEVRPVSRQEFLEKLGTEDEGYERLADAFGKAGRYMAKALAPVINLLNPQLVVIGGDVGRHAYHLVKAQLLQGLSEFAMHPALVDVSVQQTKLADDATLRGAIGLVLLPQRGDPDTFLSFLQRKVK